MIPMKGVEQSEKERKDVKRRGVKRNKERKREREREKGESSSEERDREDTIDSLSSERKRGIECMREKREREREREREIIGDDQSRNQTDEELRNFLER